MNSKEAKEYYTKAKKKYQKDLKMYPQNFDLLMEYIDVLRISGDSLEADNFLKAMKEMDFEAYQIEMLDLYKEEYVPKEQFIKYWKGELEFDQIGEK